MSVWISGQPYPNPTGLMGDYRLLSSVMKKPSVNLVSITYMDTSPAAVQTYYKIGRNLLIGAVSFVGGLLVSILTQWSAAKCFPALEKKFPFILFGLTGASLVGAAWAWSSSLWNVRKLQGQSRTLMLQNANVFTTSPFSAHRF